MELPRNWQGASPAGDTLSVELQLMMFDRVRTLLVAHSLPAKPPIYDLLWRYLTVNNHALARAVDLAITTKTLDPPRAMAIYERHCACPPSAL